MRLYMGWGEAWDLFFRSFLVFVFVGILWLKLVDPIIPCLFGVPVPILAGALYFYREWRQAKERLLKEEGDEGVRKMGA